MKASKEASNKELFVLAMGKRRLVLGLKSNKKK
jgi:hypothetical protein